jgi:TRAP transporter TAXI family solute receptor
MKRRDLLASGALAAAGLVCPGQVLSANKTFLTQDSFPATSGPGQFDVAFSQVIKKNLPIEIQLSVGKPGTKAELDAALGKVDLVSIFPVINYMMANKKAMFSKIDNAPELAQNLRGILAYPLGPYQIVTYADSGIETLHDIKGKKVFLGPPGGAATSTITKVVTGVTGLEPGVDFEAMKFDWKSANTAFVDRQMDVYISPTSLPSGTIQQFSLISPIRLLGLSDQDFALEGVKSVLRLPGRTIDTIPAGAYENMVNQTPIRTLGSWGGLGTHVGLDEQVIYDLTRTFWENIADIHATADWMKVITLDTAFSEMNVPLHRGAYRYYTEIGLKVPEALVPPGAG